MSTIELCWKKTTLKQNNLRGRDRAEEEGVCTIQNQKISTVGSYAVGAPAVKEDIEYLLIFHY